MRRLAMISLVGIGTQVLAVGARAQGCVLCYTSLAGGGTTAVKALHQGIFWLLAPALLLFIAVCSLIALRARSASRTIESPAAARPVAAPVLNPVRNAPSRQRRSASVTA